MVQLVQQGLNAGDNDIRQGIVVGLGNPVLPGFVVPVQQVTEGGVGNHLRQHIAQAGRGVGSN